VVRYGLIEPRIGINGRLDAVAVRLRDVAALRAVRLACVHMHSALLSFGVVTWHQGLLLV
jgi:hypothetical protein